MSMSDDARPAATPISGAELAALMGDDADLGDWDTEFVLPDLPASGPQPPQPTSAEAKVEMAAVASGPGESGPTPKAPPDVAKEPERQMSQSEIDALLARLLGG
jgi:hypothetical protein